MSAWNDTDGDAKVHNETDEKKESSGPPPGEQEHCVHERKLIDALMEQLKQAEERASYLSSDFENFRRRTEKQRLELVETAQTPVLFDLVSIVDDFDRAFAELQSRPELSQDLIGFELIYKALKKLLEKYGVREIKETSHFNPELHEAVIQAEDEQKASGEIVQVLQKGYTYKGSVLRPSKVSVKP
jgi:molecular chaperone GrpE